MISKIFAEVIKHKLVAILAALIVAGVGYWGYTKIFVSTGTVSYTTYQAQKGILIISVTGSGQVSVSDQIDVKTKAGGNIISIPAQEGQHVNSGQVLARLDATDAEKAVRDAEVNLQKANLDLQKIEGFSSDSEILRSEKQKAQDDLAQAYDDGFNTVSNAFLDLPGAVTGLYNVLFSYNFNTTQTNINYYSDSTKGYDAKALEYNTDAFNAYQTAKSAYDQVLADYKAATRFSDQSTIDALINKTYDATKDVAQALKSASDLIQFYKDTLTNNNVKPSTTADTHLSALSTYITQINSDLLNLLNTENTIQTDKEAVAGADIDVANQKIQVEQAQNALQDAKDNLANYSVQAPFDGIVAKINWEKGDTISNGAVFATLIATQQMADITLNEVDVANVKLGQKANLTFDAVPDLNITGKVAEIDTIGTVSQGVVTYDVKISLDTQDARVKPGMSVSAAIITNVKQNALLVPNAAVRSSSNAKYVQILSDSTPHSQSVAIGLSNDTMTEILSGLKEGDKVVTQTISGNSSQAGQQNTGLRIPGIGGGFFGR